MGKGKAQPPFEYLSYFSRYQDLIPDYEEFLEYLKIPHQQYFRINTLKIT